MLYIHKYMYIQLHIYIYTYVSVLHIYTHICVSWTKMLSWHMYIHVYIYISIYHVYPSMSILFFYFSYRQRRSKGQCYGSASQLYPSMSTKTSLNDSSAVCSPIDVVRPISTKPSWFLYFLFLLFLFFYFCASVYYHILLSTSTCSMIHNDVSMGRPCLHHRHFVVLPALQTNPCTHARMPS